MFRLIVLAFPAIALMGCATARDQTSPRSAVAPAGVSAPSAPMVPNVVVSIYRGLRLTPGSPNAVLWTNASFGVSGGAAPTLSFFDTMAGGGQPCWLQVPVTVAAVPVPVGGGGTVATPDPAVGGGNVGPWAATFDNNPAGHWSIAKATIGGVSNAQSGTFAAAAFQAMTVAGTATVVDGTAVGCH